MPVKDVIFIFDWASECQCDAGPRATGHLQISLDKFLEGDSRFHNIVVHLEAIRNKTIEISWELGLQEPTDELLAFEVMETIVHEALHCALIDAYLSHLKLSELTKIKTDNEYFEELLVEALACWSIFGVFARARALFHPKLKKVGDVPEQARLLLKGAKFMDKLNKILEEAKAYPSSLIKRTNSFK